MCKNLASGLRFIFATKSVCIFDSGMVLFIQRGGCLKGKKELLFKKKSNDIFFCCRHGLLKNYFLNKLAKDKINTSCRKDVPVAALGEHGVIHW